MGMDSAGMDTSLLIAQVDFGDWIENAVIIAIIGLSALSALGKTIAKKLNARREEEQRKTALGGQRAPTPTPGRAGPVPPVAQPLGPPTRRERTAQREVARPLPARPVPSRPSRMAPPVVTAEPVLDVVPDPYETEMIPEAPASLPPRRDRSRRESVQKRHVEIHVQPRAPAKRSVIAKREAQRARTVEQRLGHVDEGVVLPVEGDAYGARRQLRRYFSIQTLRQAVVLSEILAPPVSMRPPDPNRG